MRNFVIAVNGVPAPDLGIFTSPLEASRHMSTIRSRPELRDTELCVVTYERKRFRRLAA